MRGGSYQLTTYPTYQVPNSAYQNPGFQPTGYQNPYVQSPAAGPSTQNNYSKLPTSDTLNGPVEKRGCTDIFCCLLFLICLIAFIAFGAYGYKYGNVSQALVFYDNNGNSCSQDPTYKLALFVFDTTTNSNNSTTTNSTLVCVDTCPTDANSLTVNCLTNPPSCASGSITYNYATSNVAGVACIPSSTTLSNNNISFSIGTGTLTQVYADIKICYWILVGAFILVLFLALMYFIFLRFCGGCMIWSSIIVFFLGMIVVGTFFYLYSTGQSIGGFDVTATVNSTVTVTQTTDSMRIIAFVCWGVAAFSLLMFICLFKRIRLAVAVIKTTAMYIAETCQVAFVPLLMAILMAGTFFYMLFGFFCLYTVGTVVPSYPIAYFNRPTEANVMLGLEIVFGLWVMFFLGGFSTFVLTSSATIWYFGNSTIDTAPHRPLLTSFCRGLRYHVGSIAFASLLHNIFFWLRMIGSIFQARGDTEGSNSCTQCLVKCANCCLGCLSCFMRFLSKGAYVQMALRGTNYCTSSMTAYKLVAENTIRLAINTGLTSLVMFVGRAVITIIVTIVAYFATINIKDYIQAISTPLVPTILSGIIAFAVISLYMAIYGTSCNAIIQSFLIDELDAKAKGQAARYCPAELRELMDNHTYPG